jgi:hypothetical protein
MSKDDKNKNDKNHCLGFGIGFGLLGGALSATIIGIFLEAPLVWTFVPGLGMLVGMIIGIIMDANKNKE